MGDVYIRNADLNKWIAKYFQNQELISVNDLIGCIEDLDDEVTRLNEEIEKLEYDIQNYYRPIPKSEMYDAWYSLTQYITTESVGLEGESVILLLGIVNVAIQWNSYKEDHDYVTTAGI